MDVYVSNYACHPCTGVAIKDAGKASFNDMGNHGQENDGQE